MAKSRNNSTAEQTTVNQSVLSDEVQQFIAPYFNNYPDVNVFYVTSDKQVFLAHSKNDAINHQRGIDAELSPVEITRD